MIRLLSFIIAIVISSASVASSQTLRLPRDPDKLVSRAQEFWAAMVARQSLRAVDYVLPEKRQLFVSGSTAFPLIEARVLALNLTSDPIRSSVTVNITSVVPTLAGRTQWDVSSIWVWQRNNWFLDPHDPRTILSDLSEARPQDTVQRYTKELDASLQVLQERIDLGTIVQGDSLQREIPIKYAGSRPLSLEFAIPSPFLDATPDSTAGVTTQSTHIVLKVNSDGWTGPFNIPLILRFRYEAATVDRLLRVTGNIFAPVTFRQEPSDQAIREGQPISVFIKNNTDAPRTIRFVTVDNKFRIVKQPSLIDAQAEGELVLELRPGQVPGQLMVVFDSPVSGRESYTYLFRK